MTDTSFVRCTMKVPLDLNASRLQNQDKVEELSNRVHNSKTTTDFKDLVGPRELIHVKDILTKLS